MSDQDTLCSVTDEVPRLTLTARTAPPPCKIEGEYGLGPDPAALAGPPSLVVCVSTEGMGESDWKRKNTSAAQETTDHRLGPTSPAVKQEAGLDEATVYLLGAQAL